MFQKIEDIEVGPVLARPSTRLHHQLLDKVFLSHASTTGDDFEEEPFVVADMGEVHRLFRRWQAYLPSVRPFYAVKCNPDKHVLSLLSLLGAGFDCSSRKEMELVLGLDVAPDRIIYAQPCKHKAHLRFARHNGVRKMTFDGTDELHKIKEIYPEAQLLLRIVTDDSGSVCPLSAKYGASLDATQSLLETAWDLGLDVVGVSFHVGSSASDACSFQRAVHDASIVFEQARLRGFLPNILDVGGGFSNELFGIMSQTLNKSLTEYFPSNVNLMAEPGRYLVESAFTVVCCIIARREMPMEDGQPRYMLTLNDGIYGSFMDCFLSHWEPQPRIMRCRDKKSPDEGIRYTIWGPTCDGIDKVVDEVVLFDQLLDVGDWLYFTGMGAYSLCLSTSFNGFSSERTVYHVSTEPEAEQLLEY
ncbi:MAG: hypothetical protein Q9203_006244 [Teloschistes exilis]